MSISSTNGGPPADLDQIVAQACQFVGVPAQRRRLLRHYGNAVYLIEDAQVVARVAYGAGSVERARTAVAVTHWLQGEGFPTTEPAAVTSGDQPVVFATPGEVAVTFWRYYPQPSQPPEWDFAVLGRIARRLHDLTSVPPLPLPRFAPLRSIRQTVRNAVAARSFDEDSLGWLSQRIDSLRQKYDNLQFLSAPALFTAICITATCSAPLRARPFSGTGILSASDRVRSISRRRSPRRDSASKRRRSTGLH